MEGMRLGGIDPSIIRELSGVYKPFPKAFKELISNAFDADAEEVRVEFTDSFSSVTVSDDGCGMTPFDFRNDFTRIGGGSRRWSGDRTKRGRLRIGSKGIGFLALARYCERLRVESHAKRTASMTTSIAETPATIKVADWLGVPLPADVFNECLKISVVASRGKKRLRQGHDFTWQPKGAKLVIHRNQGPVKVSLSVDCARLRFTALLDFDKLLRLADNADLEKLDDFASIDVSLAEKMSGGPATRITAEELRPFVRKDLRAERRKGFVRNISSCGGYEQFLWYLSRCTPVSYKPLSVPKASPRIAKSLKLSKATTLRRLEVIHATAPTTILRPTFAAEPGSPDIQDDMLVDVEIKEKGLKAVGLLNTGRALLRLVNDPRLQIVDVERSTPSFLQFDMEIIRKKFPAALDDMYRLVEKNFQSDYFVPAAEVDQEATERIRQIIQPQQSVGALLDVSAKPAEEPII